MDSINELIQQIVSPLIKVQTMRGKVISVDKETDVCEIEPLRSGANYIDVKLKSVIKKTDTRCITYPSLGSIVHFSIVDNNKADTYVSQISEFDSVMIQSKDVTFEITASGEVKIKAKGIELNGRGLGGIVKAGELKKQLDKNTRAIKSIQNMFKNWTPVPNDGGAVLKGLSATMVGLPSADLSKIENKNINHG
jgi:hypothetical protein